MMGKPSEDEWQSGATRYQRSGLNLRIKGMKIKRW